MSAKRVTQFV